MGEPSSLAAEAEGGEAALTGELSARPTEVAPEMPPLKPPPQMARPGLGKAGRPIELLCNHFMVNYAGSQDVCHYDVQVRLGEYNRWGFRPWCK